MISLPDYQDSALIIDIGLAWDAEQLEKVSKEVASLLGNLYLRITSKSIQTRAIQGGHGKALSSETENSDIIRTFINNLQGLQGRVKTNMDRLTLADALEDVTLVLREV